MELKRSTIHVWEAGTAGVRLPDVRGAFSLHNHSAVSKEKLDLVPGVVHRIPGACRLRDGVARSLRRNGRPLDLDTIFWRPPLEPAAVIASETRQIEERLGLHALVVVTDHDSIDAPRGLRAIGHAVPTSVEWTVPFDGAIFHLGVHNLPASRAEEVMAALSSHTRSGSIPELPSLLTWLAEPPETFVVVNHPLWDLGGVGGLRHESLLLDFLRRFRPLLHALELNGYRRWMENERVIAFADGLDMPVVAGGDRHGLSPSTLLDVSGAASWDEFAADLRAGRRTHCVVMPEYREPFAARILQGVREALSTHPTAQAGVSRWTDRVFLVEHGIEIPLSAVWPHGCPWWLRLTVAVACGLGSAPLRPLYRLALAADQATS